MSYILIQTIKDYDALVQWLHTAPIIFADTETTSLNPYEAQLLILSLRANQQTFVIDFTKIPVQELRRLVRVLMRVRTVWHNATYDWKIIKHHSGGIELENVYCTMVAEQVLQAGFVDKGVSLKDVAERRLHVELQKNVREEFVQFNGVLVEEHFAYASQDAEVLETIYYQQQQEIQEQHLERVIDLECAVLPVTAQMEYVGLCIDREQLERAKPVFEQFVMNARKSLQDYVIAAGATNEILLTRDGYMAFNPSANSPQGREVAEILGINVKTMNRKDLVEWDAKWAAKHKGGDDKNNDINDDDLDLGYAHPYLHLRSVSIAGEKILNTYIIGILERINPVTGKVHCTYKQCGAMATGRYSSTNP